MASAAPPKRVVSSVFITLASPHRATVTPQQQPALQAHSAPAREKLHPAVRVSPGDSIPALRHSREDKSPPSESNGGLKIKGLTNAGSLALVSGPQSHNPPKHEPGKTQLQEKNDQRSSSGIYYILDFFLLVKKTIYKILENGPARPFIGSSPDQNDNLCISWPAFQNIWSQNVKYWFYTSKRLLKEPKKISSPFPRQGLSLVLDLKKKKSMRISSEKFLGLIHVWETEPMCFSVTMSPQNSCSSPWHWSSKSLTSTEGINRFS